MKNRKSLTQQPEAVLNIKDQKTGFIYSGKRCALILFLLSFLLYSNTLTHDFVLDDEIVITQNKFTKKGLSGIAEIFSYDTFAGFFGIENPDYVAGGRYRPLTLAMFAAEYELLGLNPFWAHLLTVLWYCFCVVILFQTLKFLLKETLPEKAAAIAFWTAAIFAVHPIHTEVVANIKGRDEIATFLFSFLALFFALKASDKAKAGYFLLSGLCFLAGLFAKENAVTFLAVIPLSLILFRKISWQKSLLNTLPAFAAFGVFMLVRYSVLGKGLGGEEPMELMNNPFLKWTGSGYVAFSFAEKSATIIYGFFKYLQLMIFPLTLTHDYYPRHVDIMNLTDFGVIVSIVSNAVLIIIAIRNFRLKPILSFGILFYFLTLSIFSNILFPVGTNISERFLFMPSMGLILAAVYFYFNHIKKQNSLQLFALPVIVMLLFGIKTFDRNFDWKDNATLFLTDVNTSVNSAKIQNAAGGEKIRLSNLSTNPQAKNQLLSEAKEHLRKAIKIHPTYKSAYLLLGNAFYYSEEYSEAVNIYKTGLQIAPEDHQLKNNLGHAYREAGKVAGEKLNKLNEAKQLFETALKYIPNDYDTHRLYGIACGMSEEHDKAVKHFTLAANLQPELPGAWRNLGIAYLHAGDKEKGDYYIQKAEAAEKSR
jgi:protein O-mannosyl-transferase